jgi:hypothetical protein
LVADEYADMRAKRAYSVFEFARRQLEEARREKSANDDRLNLKLHLLENYFRKFAYDRLPFAQVEHGVATYFGEPGKALMGYIAERFPREKRAADHQSTWDGFHQPVNRRQEPYTLVDACIKQAKELHAASVLLADSEEKFATAKAGVAPFSRPRFAELNGSQSILTPSLIADGSGEKRASSLLAGLAGGTGAGLSHRLTQAVEGNPKQEVEDQISELESPNHLNELRKIRAQTVLTQLMSDPEGPLSSYDPEEVLTAYNEMVQLSPRLADQPAAIAPLLNKRLMGNTEPFEVGEQVKLEKSLKDVQAPQSAKSSTTDLMKNEASIIS